MVLLVQELTPTIDEVNGLMAMADEVIEALHDFDESYDYLKYMDDIEMMAELQVGDSKCVTCGPRSDMCSREFTRNLQ